MKKFILVILAFLMMSSQICAQTKWKIYGYGTASCGHYVKVLEGERGEDVNDTADYIGFMGWFSGFASAYSMRLDEEVLHEKDADAITLWLESYCREHPMDNFSLASMELLSALGKK